MLFLLFCFLLCEASSVALFFPSFGVVFLSVTDSNLCTPALHCTAFGSFGRVLLAFSALLFYTPQPRLFLLLLIAFIVLIFLRVTLLFIFRLFPVSSSFPRLQTGAAYVEVAWFYS